MWYLYTHLNCRYPCSFPCNSFFSNIFETSDFRNANREFRKCARTHLSTSASRSPLASPSIGSRRAIRFPLLGSALEESEEKRSRDGSLSPVFVSCLSDSQVLRVNAGAFPVFHLSRRKWRTCGIECETEKEGREASAVLELSKGGTELRDPQRVEKLGETYLPYSVFLEYINGLGTSTFAPGTYHLFKHNCNSFTEEVSNFLVGKGIPKYILDLPEEILQTPLGQTLGPLIETLSSNASAGFTVGQRFVEARIQREASPEYQLLNTAIEEARLNSIALEERRNVINEKLAKKDRKKKKKKKEKKEKGSREATGSDSNSTGPSNYCANMAENENAVGETQQGANGENTPAEMLPSERVMQMEEDEKREQEEKKRRRDPPIVFKDLVDVRAEYEGLVSALKGKLNDEEQTCLDELRQYVLEDEGSWALGDNFLNFVGRILYDKSLDSDVRVKLLNVLSVAALKDDVILLLHQDRREHIIMTYAFDIDRHPPEEQLPLAQFLANMFENLSSSEWLLYISEWQHQDQNVSNNISNIRVTTKVAVHSLLSNSEDLQIRGAAIIHNLACKEVKTVVFDDVAVELTMALLQYFNGSPAEEQLYTCMKSLARFTQISGQEVPQLIQMIGPEPNKFRGTSERIDEQIEQVNKKLR